MNTDEVNFDAPVEQPTPKQKPRKTAKKKAAKPAPDKKQKEEPKPEAAESVQFAGLTRTQCADACNANGCVISGGIYCAHPVKGGLQAADMSNPAALKRLQKAREQLQVKVDPDRFK